MGIYEVFSHSIRVKYKASILSWATVFYIGVILLTFIPPLIITYRSQGFWKKIDFYREQPQVQFKHKMILVLETTSSNQPKVWSSYPKLNQFLMDSVQAHIPTIEHLEEDVDRDGRNEKLKMTIEVPLGKGEEVASVKLILVFDYKLHLYSSFQMECMAYIQHSSPIPGASLNVVGELSLHQKTPLWHRGKDLRYNRPIIDESKNDNSQYKLENIFAAYAERNVSTMFRYAYPVWVAGRGHRGPFTIAVTVLYPEEIIQYRVGFWQLLKWAWVQYFTVLALFLFVFHKIKMFIFQKRIVSTIVFSPLKQNI